MTGEGTERFVVWSLRLLAGSFAVVGLLFLCLPDGTLAALDDLCAWLARPGAAAAHLSSRA